MQKYRFYQNIYLAKKWDGHGHAAPTHSYAHVLLSRCEMSEVNAQHKR